MAVGLNNDGDSAHKVKRVPSGRLEARGEVLGELCREGGEAGGNSRPSWASGAGPSPLGSRLRAGAAQDEGDQLGYRVDAQLLHRVQAAGVDRLGRD